MKTDLCVKPVYQYGVLSFTVPAGFNFIIKHLLEVSSKKHGGFLSFTIKTPFIKRSLKQNNLLHAIAQQIAIETGNDVDDIKTYCKIKAFRRGYPAKKKENGDIVVSLVTGEPVPEISANVSKEQEVFLIEELYALASELDIKIDCSDV